MLTQVTVTNNWRVPRCQVHKFWGRLHRRRVKPGSRLKLLLRTSNIVLPPEEIASLSLAP